MSDFERVLDASDPNAVTQTGVTADGQLTSAPLEIGIQGPGEANRLLIFTGIALTKVSFAEDDGILRRGSAQVNLNYRLPESVKFVSSSTMACLANIFNLADEDTTFAVESASTEPQPINPDDPESTQELILTANLAVQGGDTGLSGMSYQANVLVRDLTPDLQSILVRKHSERPQDNIINPFSPTLEAAVGDTWDYEITFTGPLFAAQQVLVSSSDPFHVPISTRPDPISFGVTLQPHQISAVFTAPPVNDKAPFTPGSVAFITASSSRLDQSVVVQKTAIVKVSTVK